MIYFAGILDPVLADVIEGNDLELHAHPQEEPEARIEKERWASLSSEQQQEEKNVKKQESEEAKKKKSEVDSNKKQERDRRLAVSALLSLNL
jgi:hypothetical protein